MPNWLKTVLLAVTLLAYGTSKAESPVLAESPISAKSPSPTETKGGHAHGIHGMVLFGEPGRVFASHLPLYLHPHNWQVVLELSPATGTGQKTVDDLLVAGGLLTLEPERFDLLRLQPGAAEPLLRFKATLYQDHFERGGHKVAELDWLVKSTPLFLPVQIAPLASGHEYLPVGQNATGKAAWLLHRVERRPDQDQILRIRPQTRLPEAFRLDQPLTASSSDPRFQLEQVIWQDSDDLQ